MKSTAVANLTRGDILRAVKEFKPKPRMGSRSWVVIVNGRTYPPRQIVLEAAGVPPNDPTNSHQAIKKLNELGFRTQYVKSWG